MSDFSQDNNFTPVVHAEHLGILKSVTREMLSVLNLSLVEVGDEYFISQGTIAGIGNVLGELEIQCAKDIVAVFNKHLLDEELLEADRSKTGLFNSYTQYKKVFFVALDIRDNEDEVWAKSYLIRCNRMTGEVAFSNYSVPLEYKQKGYYP